MPFVIELYINVVYVVLQPLLYSVGMQWLDNKTRLNRYLKLDSFNVLNQKLNNYSISLLWRLSNIEECN